MSAQWNKKGSVTWSRGPVHVRLGGTLYISVVFTWDMPAARALAEEHRRKKTGPVVIGGPAVDLLYGDGCDWARTTRSALAPDLDWLAMHNPMATRTTRGCPNSCGFCAVPKIHGPLKKLYDWRPAPLLIDDNILAAGLDWFRDVIDKLIGCGYPVVDFNQGLDATLFTPEHADELRRLANVGTKPKVRFAWDRGDGAEVKRAVHIAQSTGLKDITVYVLTGYHDSPDHAHHRCRQIIGWDALPFPMRYQALDAETKDSYIGPGWTDGLLRDVCRYYSRKALWGIPFERYHASGDMPLLNGVLNRRER